MALDDSIEAIKKVGEGLADDSTSLPEANAKVEPNGVSNKEQFDALMNADSNTAQRVQQTDQSALKVAEANQKPSLMEEVKKLNSQVSSLSKLGPEELKQQARDLLTQIKTVKTQLTQAPQIKSSYQNVLSNHLSHIDDSLKIALSQAGVEFSAIDTPTGVANNNPINRFLGYLTQGQYQLEHLEETISLLSVNNTELQPTKMLAIQMKLGQVSLQIELFTSCLNKALESTKTLMNVQV